ncbi:putative AAA+ superfamily ATPase [Ereboglobus sp. PH5-5]|uniref:ATP-binding protein n=1 Tax=unclassified Ereboglobus TaxID=2626932 RepID=UPI0024070A39|nr:MULTISPECIES: ATP-binding protein [unclassified Ereboglobus]MDF9827292.1 putative AAA+ superfamily ATPase [Ereboglobus sp. PH5-10]MDF9833770.1 putative AAA+ superfamily ATPase [Ereboglobus sp. PH5-5]
MQIIPRLLEDKIRKSLRPNKAALLFGARRVGKTVLLRSILENFDGKTLSLNGDDLDTHALLEQRTAANYARLLSGIDLLVIDEAQSIPGIGQKLKLILDEIKGVKVIASGSSSFDLLHHAGEPLVGRSTAFHLFPFSQAELSPAENTLETRQHLEDRLVHGSYPEIVGMTDAGEKKAYLADIVNAYLLKDILSIDGIKNASKMRDLLRLVAFQTGAEVSYDELGTQLGLSRNTVEKYLDLLTQVFVIYRLGAFSRNLRKEIRKTSKWYFYDNGIRNAIIGNLSPLALRNDVGQLWESYLISERRKQNAYLFQNKAHYFWRTYDGQEIDLIEELGGAGSTAAVPASVLRAYEFKWGDARTKIPGAFSTNYPNANYTVINRDNYQPFVLGE